MNPRVVTAMAATGFALVVTSPCLAEKPSVGLQLETTLGGGWDSDYSILGSARHVPPPKVRDIDVEHTGFVSGIVEAAGWISPAEELELQMTPRFAYMQFFDGQYLLVPRIDLAMVLTPVDLVEVSMGGSYRHYSHSFFPDDSFHEPGGWVQYALVPGKHRIALKGAVSHRSSSSGLDEAEIQFGVELGWSMLVASILEVGLTARWSRIRGNEDWMQYDAIGSTMHACVDYRILDAGLAWSHAGTWFEEGVGYMNNLEAWIGLTAPTWLRTGLEYSYENLSNQEDLPDGAPYDRHVLMLTVTFAWEFSTDAHGALPEPSASPDSEGIHIDRSEVTFRVHAPNAGSVTLVGSFDDWSTETPLEGPDDKGMWSVTTTLPAGVHEVSYLVDGNAATPPGAPSTVDDGFSGQNALIVIEP